MDNDQLSIRFSEESYSTRSEVAKALGTNLIDGIWNNILIYRRNYARATSLSDISKARYQITYLSSISTKVDELANKLSQLSDLYNKFDNDSLERINILHRQRKSELYAAGKILKTALNEVAISNIINNRPVDGQYDSVVNYYKALQYVERDIYGNIDEEMLAKLYQMLCGSEELISFYRVNDFDVYSQRALINREYMGAPVRLIEELMENLLDFIRDESTEVGVKIAAILYMMDYIKPFEKYNELMAILMVKAMLVRHNVSSTSILPLESLLADNFDKFRALSKEVQKSRDLTYILSYTSSEVIRIIDNSINIINRLEITEVQNDYYRGDDPVSFKEEFGFDMPKSSLEASEPIKEETVVEEVKPVEPVAPVVEEKPVQKVEVTPTPKVNKVKSEPTILAKPVSVVSEDKNFKQMEEDMLESDPELRSHQAHFYVRHCTLGKFYTIQQYKKAEGVVYETARTSMDNLAKKGYYKREQVKNKFVYTPVKLD